MLAGGCKIHYGLFDVNGNNLATALRQATTLTAFATGVLQW
jgi:hypothetical protein